jgi:hypothetical protein
VEKVKGGEPGRQKRRRKRKPPGSVAAFVFFELLAKRERGVLRKFPGKSGAKKLGREPKLGKRLFFGFFEGLDEPARKQIELRCKKKPEKLGGLRKTRKAGLFVARGSSAVARGGGFRGPPPAHRELT